MIEDKRRCKALILDAGAFFKGISNGNLHLLAEKFYVTPSVMAEIRDKETSQNVANQLLPVADIVQRVPSADSYKKVVEFAKKTGDFAVLSRTDMEVVALCLDLEVQLCKEYGLELALKDTPLFEKVQVGGDGSNSSKHEPDGWYTPPSPTPSAEGEDAEEQSDEDDSKDLSDNVQELCIDAQDINIEDDAVDDEQDDDDDGWITPKNIKSKKSKAKNSTSTDLATKDLTEHAACMSMDYAVQNVLLQMGLGLVSIDGMQIKQLKMYVLRCHACYNITKDMSKRFCPQCGNASLLRTSCSVDSETGKVTYYLKRNFQYRLRGTVYSIPKPKGGRNNDVVLREDQKEYIRGVKKQQYEKKKQEKLWDDMVNGVFEGFGSISTNQHLNKKASHASGTTIIGFGKKNPNQVKPKRR
jgi:RNA-binding protein NOB1